MRRAVLEALVRPLVPVPRTLLVPRVLLLRALLPSELAKRSLDELLGAITPPLGRDRATLASDPAVRAVDVAVDRHLRGGPLGTTCLYRALVRFVLLRELGLDVTFVMGVRDGENDLEGHAWLELGGQPLGEVLTRSYVRTFEHPARDRSRS